MSKAVRFAVAGAIGCWLGAVLGEAWLFLTSSAGSSGPRAICLVVDRSGSMAGGKLEEMKRAAAQFVSKSHGEGARLGVVSFSSMSRLEAGFGASADELTDALVALRPGGSTNIADGLGEGFEALSAAPDADRWVLLFTDGLADDPDRSIDLARRMKTAGVRLAAIGTGDADGEFLRALTGRSDLVFRADDGDFARVFDSAGQAIARASLAESRGGSSNAVVSIGRIGVWSALLAIGLAVALATSQAWYLGRKSSTGESARAFGGGLAAGLIGGGLGQTGFAVFRVLEQAPGIGGLLGALTPLAQVGGWVALGALVAVGLAFCIPNLSALRAALGGAIGGFLGGLAFVVVSGVLGWLADQLTLGALGDIPGRWLGAIALGAAVGACVAVAEATAVVFWLEVRHGAKESFFVALGPTPVKVGGNASLVTVYARGARPVEGQFLVADGRPVYDDFSAEQRRALTPGESVQVGQTWFLVGGAAEASQAPSGATTPNVVTPPPPARTGPGSPPFASTAASPRAPMTGRIAPPPPPPPRPAARPAGPGSPPGGASGAGNPPPPAMPGASPGPPAGPRIVRPKPPGPPGSRA
jgi:Ca-activated chloride channel family protein